MNDQQQHLTQLVEQRNALASDLEKLERNLQEPEKFF